MRNASLIGTVLILSLMAAPTRGDEPQTYAVDDDGFVRHWLALPPIALNADVSAHTEASEQALFAKEYFPNQNTVTPAADAKVTVADQELTWLAVACAVPWTFAATTENALFLATTYIVCDAERPDLTLAIGSDDSSLWRVNGQEVIRAYAGRGVDRDQNKSPLLTLKPGVNVLSAAVINGLGPAGLCARFLDKDGQPVRNLKVTLTPPPPPAPKP